MAANPELERFLSLPPEQRVLDRFRLVSPLGKGGFAPVWRAVETYGDQDLREVAMKLFTVKVAEGASTRVVRARKDAVVAEARALCQVEHPNVVRFYNFASDESGTVFGLVMEYVRGTALDQMLRSREKLDVPEAVDVGVAIASALAAVHAQGIVHRDIKPANVIQSKGLYKVIDFGIAQAGARALTTQSGVPKEKVVMDDLPLETGHTLVSVAVGGQFESMSGTVGYVDPVSVAELRAANAMSDLYALGATLFECLTGMLPSAAHAKVAGRQGLSGEVLDGRTRPPPVAKLEPATPPALASLVDALLAPDPVDRPGSAEEVLAALRAVPVHAPKPRRSALPLVAAVAGVVVLVGVAIVAMRGRGDVPSSPPSSPAASVPSPPPAPAPRVHETISPRHRCSSSPPPPGQCVPWCDTDGVQVRCCEPGKAPLGPDAVCLCPPGGSDAIGCQPSTMSPVERDRLTADAIEQVTPALRACYDQGGADAGVGAVHVELELSPGGGVYGARVTQGDLPSADVQRCLLTEFRKVRFPPPPGGSGILEVPVRFER